MSSEDETEQKATVALGNSLGYWSPVRPCGTAWDVSSWHPCTLSASPLCAFQSPMCPDDAQVLQGASRHGLAQWSVARNGLGSIQICYLIHPSVVGWVKVGRTSYKCECLCSFEDYHQGWCSKRMRHCTSAPSPPPVFSRNILIQVLSMIFWREVLVLMFLLWKRQRSPSLKMEELISNNNLPESCGLKSKTII